MTYALANRCRQLILFGTCGDYMIGLLREVNRHLRTVKRICSKCWGGTVLYWQ